MKIWIIIIVLALLIAPKAFADDGQPALDTTKDGAEASSEREVSDYETITALLSHHHEVPTRELLERGSDEAQQIVFEIAQDEEAFLFHRQRAIRALAYWPDDEVYNYLVALLEDETTEDGLRHHILPVLADGFGKQALDNLKPFVFEASDPHIRISAAGAVSQIEGERAEEILLSALRSEDNPVVQSRLERFTARIR